MNEPLDSSQSAPPSAKLNKRWGCGRSFLVGCGILILLIGGCTAWFVHYVKQQTMGFELGTSQVQRVVKLYGEIEAQLGFGYGSPYALDERGNLHEVFILTRIDPEKAFGRAGLREYDEPSCGIDELFLTLYQSQGKTLRIRATRNRADIVRTYNLDVSGPPEAPDLVNVTITLENGTEAVRRVRKSGEDVTAEIQVPQITLTDDPSLLRVSLVPLIKVETCGEIIKQ
ncbi:MAG: hypothetical protein ACREJQ_03135 [bacterium]